LLHSFSALVLVSIAAATSAGATTIISESWEGPVLALGAESTTLPARWSRFSGPLDAAEIVRPAGAAIFSTTNPLGSPADGSQALQLGGTNTGIYRMSGITILPNTTYTLTAAIGNDVSTSSEFWSLQIWADANGSKGFEGSVADVFIGQEFGLSLSALNAAAGGWATNAFTFDSAAVTTVVGQQLVIFLNNFGAGTSYYDAVVLTSVANPADVPAPFSAALLLTDLLGLGLRRPGRPREPFSAT